jgi:hypothetical protein
MSKTRLAPNPVAVPGHYTNLRPLWKADKLRKGARNTVRHTEINAFGDTSSGYALGQGTRRSDSGAAQCRA